MNRVPQKNLFERGVKSVPPSVRIYSPRLEEPNFDQLWATRLAGGPRRTQMHFMLDLFFSFFGSGVEGGDIGTCDVTSMPIQGRGAQVTSMPIQG